VFDIQEVKKQVAETAYKMVESGLVMGTWGNVSARPGEDVVIITPSGKDYCQLKFADMVVVDFEGKVLEGKWSPSIELPLHLAIYRALPRAKAIVHTHSTFATAFAVANRELPVITEDMSQVVGHNVKVASYAEAGSEELARICVETLGDDNAVLMANHGVIAVAEKLSEALKICKVIEKAAEINIYASLLGGAKAIPADSVAEMRHFYLERYSKFNKQ
jgi:L-ribulose-5-phosphate 4-epimerase